MKKILCFFVLGMALIGNVFCDVIHYSIGYILSKDSSGCIESIQVLKDNGKFSKIYCYSIGNKIYGYNGGSDESIEITFDKLVDIAIIN